MRLFALAALLVVGVTQAQVAYTTKGRIVLSCDGAEVSQHNVETEASESAIRYALAHGGKASCVLKYPDKTLVIALVTAQPPATTGSATLSWVPPTQNTDGTTLTNLAGYRVVYGTSASALAQTVQLPSPSLTAYVVDGLAPGTYYFAVKSYTATGAESAMSNVASKAIQ